MYTVYKMNMKYQPRGGAFHTWVNHDFDLAVACHRKD